MERNILGFYRMVIGITSAIMLAGMLIMSFDFFKEYEENILVETKQGIIIESNKEILKSFFSEKIKYETAIKIDDEIIISNDKEIYYGTKDKINEEVEVEIENNKNTGSKKILGIR